MRWSELGTGIAIMQYPFPVFGIDFARNVTLLRLQDGRLVIHSTAPFSASDIEAIQSFGQPSWLVDCTLMHDMFAKQGRTAFPDLPYLAPPGFAEVSGVATDLLFPAPPEWTDQIDVLPIEGLRKREHALYHRASKTLVVADLIFAFPPDMRGWPRFFVRHVMRLPRLHGISVFFRMLICDRGQFVKSMAKVLALDFSQIVVAHREPVRQNARQVLAEALRDRGFDLPA